MDREIEQILHSLNVTVPSVEKQEPPAPEEPPVRQAKSSFVSWIKSHERWILWVGCSLLLVKIGVLTFFLVHGVPEGWFARERRTFRVQEAPEVEEMVSLPRTGRMVWSSDRLFPSALPEGVLAESSLFKEHLDILQAASGRRKALEEIRRDVDSLMANCIHAPDRTALDALHRAFVRFDLTDLDLTHSVVSMILSKRPLLKTPRDVQQLDETLSLAGLGRGLKEYSAMSAQIASTKRTAHSLLSKLETDRTVVQLANNLEATMNLLNGLHKSSTMASSVDIQGHRRTALDQCRRSLDQLIAQSDRRLHRPSAEERLAVAYLQRSFPEISMDRWACLDHTLMPVVPSRLPVHSENLMGRGGLFAESLKVLLPPDASFPGSALSVAGR